MWLLLHQVNENIFTFFKRIAILYRLLFFYNGKKQSSLVLKETIKIPFQHIGDNLPGIFLFPYQGNILHMFCEQRN